MEYKFPEIHNIEQVLPHVEGAPEFVVAEKNGYTVINYNVMMPDTFAPGNVIRPECRGIMFDSNTGDIIRRPFHKFFNVNEREEVQAHRINLAQPHHIMFKEDGSMIAPFIARNQILWGTKMGETEVSAPVDAFVRDHPEYITLAASLISHGFTPIFEWCSRKQRIVIDHPEDRLVLTAIRDMVHGEYTDYQYMRNLVHGTSIPVVGVMSPMEDMNAIINTTRALEGEEGFVVRMESGHMVKVKSDWYVAIHKAKEKILWDRNIVEMILDNTLDDVKAHLLDEDRERLVAFELKFNAALSGVITNIVDDITTILMADMTRKEFALEHAKNFDPYTRAVIFRHFDDCNVSGVFDTVLNTVRKNVTKNSNWDELNKTWFGGIAYNGAY